MKQANAVKTKEKKKKKKDKGEIRLPATGLYRLAVAVFRGTIAKKNNVQFKYEGFDEVKEPFVVLSNHSSRLDWMYVGAGFWPHKLNIVVTRYFYSNPKLRWLLRHEGAIPKDQFSPDVAAVKSILSVAKRGGSIMLFPEGRTSPAGRSESFERSTVKLLRHLKMPVVGMKMDGAYLTYPKWAYDIRRGKVEVKIFPLIKREEIDSLSDDELFRRIEENLFTDEYKWQREKRVSYKSDRMAEGLEGVLYLCPKCGAEFENETEKDELRCKSCSNSVRLNEFYDIVPAEGSVAPESIADWFDMQVKKVRGEIEAEPEIFMTDAAVLLETSKKTWLVPTGKGVIRADRDGLSYKGDRKGQPFEIKVPISAMSAIAYSPNNTIELYYKSEFFCFRPENKISCQKWSIFIEQLHKLSDKKE